jgi:short-subunit dehydrogenase
MICCQQRRRNRNYLESQVSILITGAASGIGRRIALDIANISSSCTLLLLDIDGEKLQNFKTYLDTQVKTRCIIAVYECDIASSLQVHAVINSAREHINLYPLACLISNAGVVVGKDIDKLQSKEVQRMLDVNIVGSFNLLREVLPMMKTQRFGTICFMSSVMSLLGSSTLSGYCASKAAINSLAESLRLELARDGFSDISVCLALPYALHSVGMFSAIGAFESPRDWARPVRDVLFPRITDKDVSQYILTAIKSECHNTFTIPYHLSYLHSLMRLTLPLSVTDAVIGIFGGYYGLETNQGRAP